MEFVPFYGILSLTMKFGINGEELILCIVWNRE